MEHSRGFYNLIMDVSPEGSFSNDVINVVSGLPRSGTSMMMQILQSSGIKPLTDGKRQADSRNEKGYFELEDVKAPSSYSSWIDQAKNRSVKVVSRFVPHLPATHFYNVIFMTRDINQVIKSQKDMSEYYSGMSLDEGGELQSIYETHLRDVLYWIRCRPNFRLVVVRYEDVVANPDKELRVVADFLFGISLDHGAMVRAVQPSLVHKR